jgi:GntR family transcriptional regulator
MDSYDIVANVDSLAFSVLGEIQNIMNEKPFIVISHANPDPMYKQVTDQIKNAIAQGIIKPGEKLPSVRNLVEELNISAITVKRAYADLEKDGYLLTRAGLGTFVSEVDREILKKEKLEEIKNELNKILNSAKKYEIPVSDIVKEINRMIKQTPKEKQK